MLSQVQVSEEPGMGGVPDLSRCYVTVTSLLFSASETSKLEGDLHSAISPLL